jgi:hypothetical protein
MEKFIRIFDSFGDSDAADTLSSAAMTPQQVFRRLGERDEVPGIHLHRTGMAGVADHLIAVAVYPAVRDGPVALRGLRDQNHGSSVGPVPCFHRFISGGDLRIVGAVFKKPEYIPAVRRPPGCQFAGFEFSRAPRRPAEYRRCRRCYRKARCAIACRFAPRWPPVMANSPPGNDIHRNGEHRQVSREVALCISVIKLKCGKRHFFSGISWRGVRTSGRCPGAKQNKRHNRQGKNEHPLAPPVLEWRFELHFDPVCTRTNGNRHKAQRGVGLYR